MAALAIMLETEADFGGRMGFVLAWGILNFSFIALLRRPALSGALSLTLVVLLVLLSRLKHDVVQMTANFVDQMVIDRYTAAYLFTIFPNLRWAMRNPTHFEIISSRRFFDHDKAAAISRDNAELIELTERTLAEAFAAGQLRTVDLKQLQIAGRALVYGFARMNIDGHFPRWGVAGPEAEQTAEAILDLFIEGIAKRA